MATIYILKLTGDNWYIGETNDLERRYQNHLEGLGTAWTKKFRPMELYDQLPNSGLNYANNVTKDYMAKYGIDKVRGGIYTKMILSGDKINSLKREIREAKDTQ